MYYFCTIKMVDTRDLAERREALKQEILDSFLENFPHYEEMTESFEDIRFEEEEIESWKEYFEEELKEIEEINSLEVELGSEFEYGVTLVDVDDWEEYVKELLEDVGYIPKDFPSWIEIDGEATANNVKVDDTEVTYQGNSYLGRA